jgi:very-short-patch-repair endonuclease/DNA polymerase III delta prime subunit
MPIDLDARLAEWRQALVDTTKRNRLIKFVTGRAGGLSLVRPLAPDLWRRLVRDGAELTFASQRELLGLPAEVLDADALSADFDPANGRAELDADAVRAEMLALCLRSSRLRPDDLLTDQADRALAARLLRLKRTSEEGQTDHGVTTLFACFGFLKWYESADSDEEIRSPLLLVPVKLGRETVESPFTLAAEEDEVLPNYCLAELLRAQFRISLPGAADALDPEDPEALGKYLSAVRERVNHVPRWAVVDDAGLGVFNFQKLAMWEDVGRNADRIKAHPLCRAIAGDSTVSLTPPSDLPTAETLDEVVPPANAVHILDADSSQHEAIEAVKRGAHLVMDGPPGTGKSQTIANMIAEALAAGKTVLFVSEKTAALAVVKSRLDRCGLGDFCLELHSHKANKREAVAELGRCLDLNPVGAPDVSALAQLAESRRALNAFVAELHAVRQPLGMSAYQVHGAVATLDTLPGRSRVAISDVFGKDAAYLSACREVLGRLAACKPVLDNLTAHPWRGCKLATFSQEAKDDARFHLTRLNGAIPAAESACAALANAGVAIEVPTVPAWDAAVSDARSLVGLPFFPKEWFASDPRAAAERAIALQRAVVDERELAAKLPEFDLGAASATELAPLLGVNADRERLTTAPALRGRLAAVQHAIPAVRRLQALAAELEAAAGDAARALTLPSVPRMEDIPKVAEQGGAVARTGAGPRSWWDAGRRGELLAVASQAVTQEEAARVARVQLLKLAPAAFAPEASAVARDAAHAGRSFWSRLLPRWWSLKARVVAWYTEPPASGSQLRADLGTLAAYHRNSDAVRHTAAAYDADVAKDGSGKAQWRDTVEALTAVEALSAAGATHDALSRQDRKAIGERAEALRKSLAAYREYAATVARDFALPDAAKQTPGELREWLSGEVAALEREATGLQLLANLLRAGQDVAARRVREAAADVARFVDAARRVRELAAGQPTDEKTRAERATLGEELIRLLDRWKRPVTAPFAAALTDKSARDALAPAIKQSEAARGAFAPAWEYVTRNVFDPDASVSDGVVLNALPLSVLAQWTADRAADADRVFEWVRFVQVEHAVADAGLSAVVEEVKGGAFPAECAADAFAARFYRLWLDALHERTPVLGNFTTDAQERAIERFADLDRRAVRLASARVRADLLGKPDRPRTRENAPDASELGVLLREVNKKRRHLPLRDLFAKLPTVLPRLKPCLMMSPLAVSTYLDSPDFVFDLVIFDEASQVRPHDAVCAIYRGKQLVVGGDPKQLPPTDFFARAGEGDDAPDEGGTGGFESLLDVCLSLGLCRKRLRWHYRSRREGLIAFSNQYFYGGTLVTFPSADEAATRAVTFVNVADGRFKDGVNVVEARRVAELVMQHARATPDQSLGVIAFSQRQQDRILDELEILRRAAPECESFFAESRTEACFVKNLENVQGDERDAIVLSVGYGPDAAGKVMMRFGPLNRQGGERRLNVAVTRARRSMTVVSSMSAGDVDLSRTSAEGAKLLRAFLDYADRGPVALAAAISEVDARDFDSPFEQAVAEELTRRGLTVHRQVGCGGYRIDLAITDGTSGSYLLGVECDGASYHSAATARDRDRLRQAVLEGLGWRLVRIWSTDWVRDRNAQVNRVLVALERAKSDPPPKAKAVREPEVAPAPKAKKEPKPPEPDHDSIEKVPEVEVRTAISGALVEFGSMPAEDLIAAASKRLGFKRVGPKIRERIALALNALVTDGTLTMIEGDRVRINRKQ